MSDEPINILNRSLSKFFTNTDSNAFDYEKYRQREINNNALYNSNQKTFKCVCLSHRQHSSPSLMGHFFDSVKLSNNGIKKAKIKIWFVGDDETMNGPTPNPFNIADETTKNIAISLAREAIITQSFSNISYNDLLTVEKRGTDFYVSEHHFDQRSFLDNFTESDDSQTASQVYSQNSSGLISKLSSFLSLPPIGDTAEQIAAAYPNSRPIANEIVALAGRLNTNPFWLANLINFETAGKFSSKVKNPKSTAVGLIQFMDYTAASLLGLPLTKKNKRESRQKFLEMSTKEQMKWVEIYLKQFSSSGFPNPTDLYMAVFFPKAIGKGENYSIYNWYLRNKGVSGANRFRRQNPGILTAGDYARFANRNARLPTGLS